MIYWFHKKRKRWRRSARRCDAKMKNIQRMWDEIRKDLRKVKAGHWKIIFFFLFCCRNVNQTTGNCWEYKSHANFVFFCVLNSNWIWFLIYKNNKNEKNKQKKNPTVFYKNFFNFFLVVKFHSINLFHTFIVIIFNFSFQN